MFDTCTRAELQTLFWQTLDKLQGLLGRLLETGDTHTANVLLAAVNERNDLLAAINLELARRATGHERTYGEITDD